MIQDDEVIHIMTTLACYFNRYKLKFWSWILSEHFFL